jgi:hypothetical protein
MLFTDVSITDCSNKCKVSSFENQQNKTKHKFEAYGCKMLGKQVTGSWE